MDRQGWVVSEYEKALSAYRDSLIEEGRVNIEPGMAYINGKQIKVDWSAFVIKDDELSRVIRFDAIGPPMGATDEEPVLHFKTRYPNGLQSPTIDFRVAPMDDPLTHFHHGAWYRIEVIDGKPTIREVGE